MKIPFTYTIQPRFHASSPPGTTRSRSLPAVSGLPPPVSLLIRALARINIRIPAGSGHGVVLGRGRVDGELLGVITGGLRSRFKIGPSLRSITYSCSGAFIFDDIVMSVGDRIVDPEKLVGKDDEGVGRRISSIFGSVPFWYNDVSKAIVVRMN